MTTDKHYQAYHLKLIYRKEIHGIPRYIHGIHRNIFSCRGIKNSFDEKTITISLTFDENFMNSLFI